MLDKLIMAPQQPHTKKLKGYNKTIEVVANGPVGAKPPT